MEVGRKGSEVCTRRNLLELNQKKNNGNNGGQKKNNEKISEKNVEKNNEKSNEAATQQKSDTNGTQQKSNNNGTQQKSNNNEGAQKKKSVPKVDVSLLQQPMQVSMRGVQMILKCMEDGTREMKELLMRECDVIFECKVCRSMFRGLPNLLSHKRSFCIKQFVDKRTEFPRENPSDTCYVEPTEPDPQYAEPEDEVTVAEVRARRGRMRDPILFALSKNIVEPNTPPPGPLPLNSIMETLPPNVKISTDLSPQKLQQLNSSRLSVELSPLKKQLTSPVLGSMVGNLSPYQVGVKKENGMEDDSSSSSSLETAVSSPGKGHNTQMDMLRSMKNVDISRNRCLQCRKSFLQWQYLLSHMRTKHAAERKLYKCTLCETVFQYTRSISRHLIRRHKKSHKEIVELVNVIRENPIMVKTENAMKAVKEGIGKSRGKNGSGADSVSKGNFSLITCRMCNKVFGKMSTRTKHEKNCSKRVTIPVPKTGEPGVVKRGRGRPRKSPIAIVTPDVNGPMNVNGALTPPTENKPGASPPMVNGTPNKRKGGRPCKVIQNVEESLESTSEDECEKMLNGSLPIEDVEIEVDEVQAASVRVEFEEVQAARVKQRRGRGSLNRQPSSKSGSDGENVKSKGKAQVKPESPTLSVVAVKKEPASSPGKVKGTVLRTGYRERFQDIAKPYMDPKDLKCLICGQLFLLKPTLITHVCAQHLQMRRFKCTLCNWKALFKSEVIIHLRHKHHRETGTKVKDKLIHFVESL